MVVFFVLPLLSFSFSTLEDQPMERASAAQTLKSYGFHHCGNGKEQRSVSGTVLSFSKSFFPV